MTVVVHKTKLSPDADGKTFVLTDMTEDNYSDVVGDRTHPTLGWDLESFRKNPIALWSHDSKTPIGKWPHIWIENGAVKGKLVLAPAGISSQIDSLRALIDCGVLRGVSVGFMPTQSKPLPSGGTHYQRMRLVEVSLCAVPANPSALMEAKRLGVSTDLIRKVFVQGNHLANAEAIAKSRASTRKARELIKPKLLEASPEATRQAAAERAAKDAYNRASLARARAMLAKSKSSAEAAERAAKDAYNRASLARAKAMLANSKSGAEAAQRAAKLAHNRLAKDADNRATLERVKAEVAQRAAKNAYNRASLARAKAMLAESKRRVDYQLVDDDE
jgi:HK97 family phage prohead protease